MGERRRRVTGHLRRRTVLLFAFGLSVLFLTVRRARLRATTTGGVGSFTAGFVDERQSGRSPGRGIMQGEDVDDPGNNREDVVVPPHLRGYYAENHGLGGGGAAQQQSSSQQSLEEQEKQLLAKRKALELRGIELPKVEGQASFASGYNPKETPDMFIKKIEQNRKRME